MKNSDFDLVNWFRYILAIITLLSLIALYYILKSLNNDLWIVELFKQVIPDLIAVLITIIVVYIVFSRKGITEGAYFKQSIIADLISAVKENTFGSETDINNILDFKNRLPETKELLIVAYSSRFVLSGFRQEIANAVLNKTDIKIIVIQPNSTAAQLLIENSSWQGTKEPEIEHDLIMQKQNLQWISNYVNEKKKGHKVGKIELRYISWLPSCSLIFFIPKLNGQGVLKLKVYAVDFNTPLPNIRTHMIIYENKEKDTYDYFLNQFYGLWQKGVPSDI